MIEETKPEDLRNKDLSPTMIAKFTEPKKTWFIERTGDHFVFACEEVEAWKLLTNRSGWTRRDFKIIGVSDGTTYDKIIKEAKGKAEVILKEIKEVEAEANKYRATEQKFVFEDLLELTDEKVKKVKSIIKDYDLKLEKMNKSYFDMTRDVAITAFNAELEVAKNSGNREFPTNQDINTPGASAKERRRIVNKMGQD